MKRKGQLFIIAAVLLATLTVLLARYRHEHYMNIARLTNRYGRKTLEVTDIYIAFKNAAEQAIDRYLSTSKESIVRGSVPELEDLLLSISQKYMELINSIGVNAYISVEDSTSEIDPLDLEVNGGAEVGTKMLKAKLNITLLFGETFITEEFTVYRQVDYQAELQERSENGDTAIYLIVHDLQWKGSETATPKDYTEILEKSPEGYTLTALYFADTQFLGKGKVTIGDTEGTKIPEGTTRIVLIGDLRNGIRICLEIEVAG